MGKKTAKKLVKKKVQITDGLGPHEIKRIRAAIRQVWHRSFARALVVKRCLGRGGFSYCEQCKKRAPKIFIDHIQTVGEVDSGFIERLFCPSGALQGLCKTCHDHKTKMERGLKSMGL